MKRIFKRLSLVIVLLATTLHYAECQDHSMYSISITIPELGDSTLYLAYHYGDKQYIRDSITLDKKGTGIFTGKEMLPEGVYMIVLPDKHYFEILISDDQSFSASCSYPEYKKTLKFKDSPENIAFLKYQKKWMSLQNRAADIAKRLKNNSANADSATYLKEVLMKHEASMKAYLEKTVKENSPNILSVLVKAMIPIDIPDFTIPISAQNPDSLRWVLRYNYNKDHYFDNIDLTDSRMLRTPIFHSRLDVFFNRIVIQSADSINKEIDRIMEKCESNHDVFQYVAVYLFNHFRTSEIMGHDAVIVKLADDIYLSGKADWVSDEFVKDLKRQIDLIRNNLIGLKAKDLVMDSFNHVFVSLYDIEKDFTILYFWEPNCGHCKKVTPKLKEIYDKIKDEGVEVFSVCTTDNKEEWANYIKDNNLDWINGWDPERKTHFDYYYNIQSTPIIYILDRDKKIIAKKISVDDVSSFISTYRKYFYK